MHLHPHNEADLTEYVDRLLASASYRALLEDERPSESADACALADLVHVFDDGFHDLQAWRGIAACDALCLAYEHDDRISATTNAQEARAA